MEISDCVAHDSCLFHVSNKNKFNCYTYCNVRDFVSDPGKKLCERAVCVVADCCCFSAPSPSYRFVFVSDLHHDAGCSSWRLTVSRLLGSVLFLIFVYAFVFQHNPNGYDSGWDQGWSREPGKGHLCTYDETVTLPNFFTVLNSVDCQKHATDSFVDCFWWFSSVVIGMTVKLADCTTK